MYDLEGYEYTVDEYAQIYLPLKMDPADAMTIEEETKKEIKNLKRSYASLAAADATRCSASTRLQKGKKNWREAVKYLHSRADKARILWREGSMIADVIWWPLGR